MNKKEFDRLYVGENIVVNCSTRELAEEFLGLADSFGYRWIDGDGYIGNTYWSKHKDDIGYCLYSGYCGDLRSGVFNEFSIVKFSTLQKETKRQSRGFKKKKAFIKL